MPEWAEEEEIQLLFAAQHGDTESFGKLYETYAPAVFRFLFAHLSERMEAEDLTGEVFLRAWRSLASYQAQGLPFSAYLFRIARNALIDQYRRNRHSLQDVSLEDDLSADPQSDPSDVTLAVLERKEIRAKMEALREEYRTVLVLRFLSDLSPEETAASMGKSPGAIRVLQHRALAALRKLIGSEDL